MSVVFRGLHRGSQVALKDLVEHAGIGHDLGLALGCHVHQKSGVTGFRFQSPLQREDD